MWDWNGSLVASLEEKNADAGELTTLGCSSLCRGYMSIQGDMIEGH